MKPDKNHDSSKTTYDPGDRPTASTTTPEAKPNQPATAVPPRLSTTSTAGPAALPTPDPASPVNTEADDGQLKFHFAPTMGPLLFPPLEDLPEGTDAWAFAHGYTSVTPLKAAFAGLEEAGKGFGSDDGWTPGAEWM
jgi:tubulin--tyrosine ligase